jgi:hypothetical protein
VFRIDPATVHYRDQLKDRLDTVTHRRCDAAMNNREAFALIDKKSEVLARYKLFNQYILPVERCSAKSSPDRYIADKPNRDPSTAASSASWFCHAMRVQGTCEG